MTSGLDERGLAIANIRRECQENSFAIQKLQEELFWNQKIAGQNAAQIFLLESKKSKMEAVIRTLQVQINGQLGLAATAEIDDLLLLCKEAVEKQPAPVRPTLQGPDNELF